MIYGSFLGKTTLENFRSLFAAEISVRILLSLSSGSHFNLNSHNENYASKTTRIIIACVRGNWRMGHGTSCKATTA